MPKISTLRFTPLVLVLTLAACAQNQDSTAGLVRNIDEFNAAAAALQPGDRIVLANGTWTDVHLMKLRSI